MTVIPVIDYEPGTVAPGTHWPTAVRRFRRPPTGTATTPPSEAFRRAAAFTDAALRSILEVIDRRRPLTQLRAVALPGLVDSVATLIRDQDHTSCPPASRGGAALHRVHMQPVDPDERAFEVSAVYRRGRRLHAVAGRVEWIGTPPEAQWRVVALHLG